MKEDRSINNEAGEVFFFFFFFFCLILEEKCFLSHPSPLADCKNCWHFFILNADTKGQTKHVIEVTEIYFVTTARTHEHYYKKHPEICFLSFDSSRCCPIHKEIAFNTPLQSYPDSQPSKDRTADIPSGGI